MLQHNLEAMKQVTPFIPDFTHLLFYAVKTLLFFFLLQAQDGIKLSKLDLTAIHDVRASSILYINSLATSSFVSAVSNVFIHTCS